MIRITKTVLLLLAMAMIAASTANADDSKLKTKSKARAEAAESLSGAAMQAATASMGAPQIKDELFAGAEKFAQGASEVTEINLDPKTMGMIGRGSGFGYGIGSAGKEGSLASKMNFMVVRSYKYDKPGMYSMDDFQAYSKKLTDGSWSCPIHVRGKSSSTDICSRTAAADNETNEMVILTAEPRELTFIHMSGKMSLSELNRMSNSPGAIVLPRTPVEPIEPKAPKVLILPPPATPAPVTPRSSNIFRP